MDARMTAYWNHNSAYHPWICRIAIEHRGSVLDVGCGEGLLIQRLSPISAAVTGIDPDSAAVARARSRVSGAANATVEQTGFLEYAAKAGSYDLVTFVASLHHLDLTAALRKASTLLRPSGELIVVGLSANKTAADWMASGIQLPVVRLGSWLHRETRDIGVVALAPSESLGEIRAVAHRELPGARVRRALYYRYLLRWKNT